MLQYSYKAIDKPGHISSKSVGASIGVIRLASWVWADSWHGICYCKRDTELHGMRVANAMAVPGGESSLGTELARGRG